MTDKPEILFAAHRIPYPPNKGDKIRSWRLFQHLCERFRVHLACFVDDPRDFAHTEFLSGLAETTAFIPFDPGFARFKSLRGFALNKPLSFEYFKDNQMATVIAEIRQRPLAAEVVFSSSMAPYIAHPIDTRKRIVDFCDADSEKWRQYAETSAGPMRMLYKREGRLLADAEIEIANWADVSFAVTPEEAAIFNSREDMRRKVLWWSNGVDSEFFDPSLNFRSIERPADIVFVGAMDYRANIDAVLTFAETAWLKVRDQLPAATFAIVGANPTKEVEALNDVNGITVTGRVDDVRPWLHQAKLAVAPLQVARGVQNKVLEAMAMGKAVVASPQAVTGINHNANAICMADDAENTAQAIIALLNNAARRDALGAAARANVLCDYHWDAQLARFDAALGGVGPYSLSSKSSSSLSTSSVS